MQPGVKDDGKAGKRSLKGYARMSHAFVRITNWILAILCSRRFCNYIDYTSSKASRLLDRSIEFDRHVRVYVALRDGSFESPPEIQSAVARLLANVLARRFVIRSALSFPYLMAGAIDMVFALLSFSQPFARQGYSLIIGYTQIVRRASR
ncbi:hypothetical protein CIC12_23865 [Burkholderia sp. SG-MS1]|nr:hypothetical protein [Paraburkholderia sp. SG-MS1]